MRNNLEALSIHADFCAPAPLAIRRIARQIVLIGAPADVADPKRISKNLTVPSG